MGENYEEKVKKNFRSIFLFSYLIERDMKLFPFAVSLFLSIFLFGTLFWIITYIYYSQESKELRDIMAKRRKELDEKRSFNPAQV